MSSYQHWKNLGQGEDVVFVTTTALDFVHVFSASDFKERMTHLLFRDHELYGATLFGFVVDAEPRALPDVIAQGARCELVRPTDQSQLGAVVEAAAGRGSTGILAQQSGLNGRTFWQRSFRSVVVHGEGMFLQKLKYIHMNPVKTGLVERPEQYRWSSARLYLEGEWDERIGLSWSRWRSVHSGAVEA